jgi:uncharacterized OB-fold protein
MTRPADAMAQGVDPDNDAFWLALGEGHIQLRSCDSCGAAFVLPLPSCPECGSDRLTLRVSGGSGSLYSWVIVHVPFGDGLDEQVPYVVAAVELDEGARIFARLEGVPQESLVDGLRVSATFPVDEGRPPIVFVPGGGAS